MIPNATRMLIEAINSYDYPPVTYDFAKDHERRFTTMRDLESYLQNLLRANDEQSVKNGLSGVLYWGHYRAGYRDHRVRRFHGAVTDVQLRQAIQVFSVLEGTCLKKLKKLELPEFSNMAFITKLRTFLEPERYCVLDGKIASLGPVAARLKREKTFIPITEDNEQAYRWWVDLCGSLAWQLQMPIEPRPVDVERGLFHLVDHSKREVAEQLLSSEAFLRPRPSAALSDRVSRRDDLPVPPLCRVPSACHDGSVGTPMQKQYVRVSEGAYRVGNTRVSLDSLVYLFREGMSVEGMVECYPALTLEQVHGALAFYLANQGEIDAYLADGQRIAESEQRKSRQTNAELIAKLRRARDASQIPG